MSKKKSHYFEDLKDFYTAQNSREIIAFFEKQTMVENFPQPLKKEFFFENLSHFILEFEKIRFYQPNRPVFNDHSIRTNIYNTPQYFRLPKDSEQYHALPILLMELYYKSHNDLLKNEIYYMLSSLNKFRYVNIHTYTKMEHSKIKPFAGDFLNCYIDNLNLFNHHSGNGSHQFKKLIFTIIENNIIDDEINTENASFVAKTINENTFDKSIQKHLPNLFRARQWISSTYVANENLLALKKSFSDKNQSWLFNLSKFNIKQLYKSHQIIKPEEGFLYAFADKLSNISRNTIIEENHVVFKYLKNLLIHSTPDMFKEERDKESLFNCLSHVANVNYLNDYLNILSEKEIYVNYNDLFISTFDNLKRSPQIHVAILKHIKNYSFNTSDVNHIWSKIIRENNLEILKYISESSPEFPKIEDKLIILFYGNNLSQDIMEFELWDDEKHKDRKGNKILFHKTLLSYINENYHSQNFSSAILETLKPCIPGELKSFIEHHLITTLTLDDNLEENKTKRRL